MIFFTADIHSFHTNIIKYENRPFKTSEEMNEVIKFNWNSIISEKDDVYILGDVGFTSPNKMYSFLTELKGNKYLIIGNHDKSLLKDSQVRSQFIWCKDYFKLKHANEKIILFHYPIYSWDCKHHSSWHLHGHVHTTSHEDFYYPTKLNVGMDLWNFTPVSFDQVKKKINDNLSKENINENSYPIRR